VIEALLETHQLMKHFGAMTVTASVSLAVRPGEIHALIGPNGAGKTTLIAQLAGELDPDSGAIAFQGRDITSLPVHERARLGIRRMFQLTSVFRGYRALDNVLLALQAQNGHSFRFWKDGLSDGRLRRAAQALLDQVGIGDRAEVKAGTLSHGEQRQLELAMVLAGSPRLLLLDEPTAGMGIEETERMVELLSTLRGKYSVLLVEHDMDAVYALADRVTVLVYGRVIASGTVREIRLDPEVRLAYLGDDETEGPDASNPPG
jgi:branched-chain amino acid transport system ATP-binding protein